MQPRYGRIAPLQNENENIYQQREDENNDISDIRKDQKEEEELSKNFPKRFFRGASAVRTIRNYKDQEKQQVFFLNMVGA